MSGKNTNKSKNAGKSTAKKNAGNASKSGTKKPVVKLDDVANIMPVEEVLSTEASEKVKEVAAVDEVVVAEEIKAITMPEPVVEAVEAVEAVVETVEVAEVISEPSKEENKVPAPEKTVAIKKSVNNAAVPAWDVETWISLSNLKLGIPAYAMAAALHGQASGTMLTEDEVKRLLTSVLGTRIN